MAKSKLDIAGIFWDQDNTSLNQYLAMVDAKRAKATSEEPAQMDTSNLTDEDETSVRSDLPDESNVLSEPAKRSGLTEINTPPEPSQSRPDPSKDETPLRTGGAEIETVDNEVASPSKTAGNSADLSKNLNKSAEFNQPETAKEIAKEKVNTAVRITPLKESKTASPVLTTIGKVCVGRLIKTSFGLLDYVTILPVVYESTAFLKGEMKVRISPRMASNLRLLCDVVPPENQPKFLIENLLNELIRNFFQQHQEEIAQLNQERLKRELVRGELKL